MTSRMSSAPGPKPILQLAAKPEFPERFGREEGPESRVWELNDREGGRIGPDP